VTGQWKKRSFRHLSGFFGKNLECRCTQSGAGKQILLLIADSTSTTDLNGQKSFLKKKFLQDSLF